MYHETGSLITRRELSMIMLLLICLMYIPLSSCSVCQYVHIMEISDRINIYGLQIVKFCTGDEYLEGLTQYYIQNCGIQVLGTNLFKNYNLKIVNFNNNHIRELLSFTFTNISVSSINLNYNRIEIIYNSAFNDLKSLTEVSLSYNILKQLKNTYFKKSTVSSFSAINNYIATLEKEDLNFLNSHTRHLNLANNKIKNMDNFVFGNRTISVLNLTNNEIRNVMGIFSRTEVWQLYIEGNNITDELELFCDVHAPIYGTLQNKYNPDLCRVSTSVWYFYMLVVFFIVAISVLSITKYVYVKCN